ncbi:jg2406, partial [Pararge aegeria aegeria]
DDDFEIGENQLSSSFERQVIEADDHNPPMRLEVCSHFSSPI